MVSDQKRVEELREYFRKHNKSKEQRPHTCKVCIFYIFNRCFDLTKLFYFSKILNLGSYSWMEL